VVGATGLRSQHPHHTVVRQRADRIHQRVDEIAVAVAPPQQHHVDDLVGVLVEQFRTGDILDGDTNLVIDVLVPSEFLNHMVVGDTELLNVVLGVRRGDHGGSLLQVGRARFPGRRCDDDCIEWSKRTSFDGSTQAESRRKT
jgi:hypothetical protein